MDNYDNNLNNSGLPQGYLDIAPTKNKLSVSNLVNFSEPASSNVEGTRLIAKIGKSLLYLLVYVIVCTVLSFIIRNLFVNIIVWLVLLPLPFRLVSIFIWGERSVRRDFEALKGLRDSEVDYSLFISFYEVGVSYPHIIRFIDGSIGCVLELVRGTEVGDLTDKAYNHAEVLTEFYNQCGVMGITPEFIDIQSLDTHDSRFNTLYSFLSSVENPTMQSILSSMFSFLEESSRESQLTYEYFVLHFTGDDDYFVDSVNHLRRSLSNGGYRGVRCLGLEAISKLIGDLYGIADFPINLAMKQVISKSNIDMFQVLWLGDASGKRKVVGSSPRSAVREDSSVGVRSSEGTGSDSSLGARVGSLSSELKDSSSGLADLFGGFDFSLPSSSRVDVSETPQEAHIRKEKDSASSRSSTVSTRVTRPKNSLDGDASGLFSSGGSSRSGSVRLVGQVDDASDLFNSSVSSKGESTRSVGSSGDASDLFGSKSTGSVNLDGDASDLFGSSVGLEGDASDLFG